MTLGATASSGLPVSFRSTTPDVCTVSGTTVTLVKEGICTIVASQTGNDVWDAAPEVTQSFGVLGDGPQKLAQTMTFAKPGDHLLTDPPFALAATASSGLAISHRSATPAVCTVTGKVVTLVAAGICRIVASQPGNEVFTPRPRQNGRSRSLHRPMTTMCTCRGCGASEISGVVAAILFDGRPCCRHPHRYVLLRLQASVEASRTCSTSLVCRRETLWPFQTMPASCLDAYSTRRRAWMTSANLVSSNSMPRPGPFGSVI